MSIIMRLCSALLFASRLGGTRAYSGACLNCQSERWSKLSDDPLVKPLNETALTILTENEAEAIWVSLQVNRGTSVVSTNVEMTVVLRGRGRQQELPIRTGGLRLLVLHQEDGRLLLNRHFRTHEPGESRVLRRSLASLSPGRILLLLILPPGTAHLDEVTRTLLEVLGSQFISKISVTEYWIFATSSPESWHVEDAETRGRKPLVWAEVLSTTKGFASSPFKVDLKVTAKSAPPMNWPDDPALLEQRQFCADYEGFPQICSPSSPLVASRLRSSSERIEEQEAIPLGIIASKRPHHLYNLLVNILRIPGASQTKILLLLDGVDQQVRRMASLFRLPVLSHRTQGPIKTRVQNHVKFALMSLFNAFPAASKAIFLEDDLLVSPDFFSFFQQTARLLDSDNGSLLCVNAFSGSSFPGLASDASRMLRLDVYPQNGWMVTRKMAEEMISLWVKEEDWHEWDIWLGNQGIKKGRHALVPEVSRTLHVGSAGVHVTGWEQEYTFNNMIYNQEPKVTLKDLHVLVSADYDRLLVESVSAAVDVPIPKDMSSCRGRLVSRKSGGTFRIFVDTTRGFKRAFLFIMKCLRAGIRAEQVQYKGVLRFNVDGSPLYVIGCPFSPFCNQLARNASIWVISEKDLEVVEKFDFQYKNGHLKPFARVRRKPETLEEEMTLDNLDELVWI